MEDSLINIDDEYDSFSLSSDTDIRNIVDQWKRNHESDVDQKYVDTRTFTRPKKKAFDAFAERREISSIDELPNPSTSCDVPKIDLQIGGLVTSLQRSMLGDCSPPSHMDHSMGNSLITSNDFSNIDFINETGDSLSMANFNQYRLSDAISDRNFLERLTNYDESLFTKDADINNTELIDNGNCTGSSTSTLQNSTDSCLDKNDGTFIFDDAKAEVANNTFNAMGEVNKTFIQALDAASTTFDAANTSKKNRTFDAKQNETFEAKPVKPMNTTQVLSLEDEELSLCDSFNASRSFLQPDSLQSNLNSTFQLDECQSTPAVQKRKSRRSDTLETISPIFSDKIKSRTANLTQNFDQFVDIEIEDVYLRDAVPKNMERVSNPTGIDTSLREKERQSLAKFEEFEHSLLILENNKTEEEFDDMLNSFSTNVRNTMTEKVRQSLDNIKKRHSLIGMEKQQQDELNREKVLNRSGKYAELLEKSRMAEPMISSTSSNGSGERLLRRSRLFDDVISASTERLMELDKNQLNATQTLDKTIELHLERKSPPKTDNEEKPQGRADRDRFKTIRIFKRPPENAVQVPDPIDVAETHIPLKANLVAFSPKNTNSPNREASKPEPAAPINTMTFKRSALARPRQLSGLVKRDMYTKSNSQEMLAFDEPKKTVSQIKSPMGIKSKSIHNLSTVKTASKPEAQPARNYPLSSHTFKVPAPKAAVVMRQRPDYGQPKKLSLIRPSSGYYSYNSRRTDSDTDLAVNSLSSGSSKSSLNQGENELYANENPNATFVQPLAKAVPSRPANSGIVPPKVSLLRPPNQIRRSALPRPSTATKR